jgi:hypothetical protein
VALDKREGSVKAKMSWETRGRDVPRFLRAIEPQEKLVNTPDLFHLSSQIFCTPITDIQPAVRDNDD